MTASMNDLMRYGGRGASTGKLPGVSSEESASGSRDFTVQEPGTHSPTDQFIYEPLIDSGYEGAWVVYPPGVPCDPEEYRISRASPAGVGDFEKMKAALDESSAGSPEASETSETTEETDTGELEA